MVDLPAFASTIRHRPIDLVVPLQAVQEAPDLTSEFALPRPAPYAAVLAEVSRGPLDLFLASGTDTIRARYDGKRAWLDLPRSHRSTIREQVDAVALTLTGRRATMLTRTAGLWTARSVARVGPGVHDEAWLAALRAGHQGHAERLSAGGFGQLGLRDPRVVSNADGTPYLHQGQPLLTMTSAGPGFFETAHTSVWALDPDDLSIEHRADLYFRRPGKPGVYGDHATHLVRDGDRWLVATSTWGDFEPRRGRVEVTLARTRAEVTGGEHVLDTEPLPLPVHGLGSVGVWDPHLVQTGQGWLVGYVSARKYFDFFPVVASGPSLEQLAVNGAATDRHATEGTTLFEIGGTWRVLASDGRDNPAPHRAQYPVFDLAMRPVGSIAAPYPSNIPWPTLLRNGTDLMMIGFDGSAYGGRLLGYGTHGSLRIARATEPVSG